MDGSIMLDLELRKVIELSKESYELEQNKRKKDEEMLRKQEEFEKQQKENQEKENRMANENEGSSMKLSQTRKWPWDEATSLQIFLCVTKWEEKYIKHGIGSGLQNLGNSCFMNATLQCLAYTPPFAQLMAQYLHRPICKKRVAAEHCLLCDMESTIPEMLMGSPSKPMQASSCFKNLQVVNDLFTPGCQEDAHEYLQSLLDRLDSAYDDTLPNKNKQRKFVNPTKLMEGAIKTDIMCGGCRRHSFTEEPFYCLSLSAEDTTSLEESLVILSHDELMQGNDKYFCVECQNKKVSKKKMTISRLPPILIIHLKRFCVAKYSSQHKQVTMHKISQHIQFPELLDFGEKSPYIHEDDLNRIENGDRKYELYAILVHSGPQVGYGHYYALVKSPSGDWFKMNDSQVLPIPIKRVLKEQAYLLFYRRTTHMEMDYRLATLTGMEADASVIRQHLSSENESKSAKPAEDEESSSSSAHTSNSANETGIREDLITQNYFEESECKRPNTDTSGSVEVIPKKILHHIDTADGVDEYQMVGMPSSTSS